MNSCLHASAASRRESAGLANPGAVASFRSLSRAMAVAALVICLPGSSVAQASVLGDTAATVGRGEWVKLSDGDGFLEMLRATPAFEPSQMWTDSASWDPVNEQIVLVTKTAGTSPRHFEVRYDLRSHTWHAREFNRLFGAGDTPGHGYDGNTWDPAGSRVFFQQWSNRVTVGRWNDSTNLYDWSELPDPPVFNNNDGLAFIPWLDGGNGGLLIGEGDADNGFYWYDFDNPTWSRVDSTDKSLDGAANHIEVNLAREYVSVITFEKHWTWRNGEPAFVTAANAPCYDSQGNVRTQNLVYDPTIQKLVKWCSSANEFFSYDIDTNTWTKETGLINYPSELGGGEEGTNTASVAIPEHQIVAFIKLETLSSCESWASENGGNGRCGIWLTRFGSSSGGTGAECADGRDNDGDGLVDASDPGCASETDPDESNCGDGVCEGAETPDTCSADCTPLPACSDGIDNDGDGFCDTADSGCTDGVPGDVGCLSAETASEANCGDAVCSPSETNESCPVDCGSSSDPNVINPGDVEWDYPTPYSIGYRIRLNKTGGSDSDANGDSSVEVRYRVAGSSTWKRAYPPLLVEAEVIKNAQTPSVRNYSGAIWDLIPATAYEVEFTISDPDGYNEVRTEIGQFSGASSSSMAPFTRPEPVESPEAPNFPCPDGDASDTVDDGQVDYCSTVSQIQTAIDAATPGSVIRIAPGLYDFDSGDGTGVEELVSVVSVSGTERNPIVIECVDRSATVLDGEQADHVIKFRDVSYVYLQDCTLRGSSEYVLSDDLDGASDITGLVIRRNDIVAGSKAVFLKHHRKRGIDIIDNSMKGPESFPSRMTSNTEGIVFHGQGNVIAHNFISSFGDSIGTSLWKDGAVPFEHRNNLVFGNDIEYSEDDCIEADYSHTMIVHDNRCENYNSCLSMQPTFGGPIYFFRNVCWSGGEVKTLKIQAASSTYGNPSGAHIFNNLLSMPILRYSSGTWHYKELNNLFVGRRDGYWDYHSNTSANLCDAYEPATGGDPRQCDNHGEPIDYAALSHDGTIDYPACGNESNLANFKARTTCYQNSLIATDPIFEAVSASEYPTLDNRVESEQAWFEIQNPGLHPTSNLIDAGTIIPNVTDGYLGQAPDIGPQEYGTAVYPYGVRGWTAGVRACEDGIDNDQDGAIDMQDRGCVDSLDASERGPYSQCDNGLDDDGDGKVDFGDDPECTSAADNSEAVAEIPTDPPPAPTGLTVGGRQ